MACDWPVVFKTRLLWFPPEWLRKRPWATPGLPSDPLVRDRQSLQHIRLDHPQTDSIPVSVTGLATAARGRAAVGACYRVRYIFCETLAAIGKRQMATRLEVCHDDLQSPSRSGITTAPSSHLAPLHSHAAGLAFSASALLRIGILADTQRYAVVQTSSSSIQRFHQDANRILMESSVLTAVSSRRGTHGH